MKTLLILLIAGIGLGAVFMDKNRQLAAPLKASAQSLAPQLWETGRQALQQIRPVLEGRDTPVPPVLQAQLQLPIASEPELQFRIIQGEQPASREYVAGRQFPERCYGIIHFDLHGRAFCEE